MLEAIKEIVGESRFFTADAIGADYCHDECPGVTGTPDAVVEIASTEQAAAVIKLCAEAGVPVTVRGAGTGQAGGSVPVEGGVVLSLKGMDQILEFDEAARTLRVQPGVLLQDVKAEAEKRGLYYPPDPGEKTATIGGNAATNASGPYAVKYGVTRDYIAALTVVRADGNAETLSGADLESVIGSEGTLAVITELTLKLIDKPKADAILLFPFMDTETCLNAANTLLAKDYAPAVVEYMDTDIVEFSGNVTGNPVFPVEMDGERVGATLMLTLEGEDDDSVMEKMEEIAELAEEIECLDILVGDTPTMKREFWAAHDAFHTSMESGAKNAIEYNITVPAEKIAEMVEYAKAEGEAKGLKVMAYAHVGSGGMHIHAVSDGEKAEFAAKVIELAALIYGKCSEFGGSIRGEYGIGCAKKQYLGAEALDKFSALKAKYDPKGILNPGKAAD
ncbi:MAG: FAD-binding oxidoreductase [Candidatus Limivicinus sp.]|nr:FAD-binding oxidoreductase [Candidatus Limivicinus sp.]